MRGTVSVVLAALLAAPLVMAQYNTVVADIPFPFIVSGKTHAAGEWTLSKVSNGAVHVWVLKDGEQRNVLLVQANSVYRRPDGATKLTFNRYEDRYFLSEIWMPGEVGYYIPPGKQERALRLAGVKPERTVMFTRLR